MSIEDNIQQNPRGYELHGTSRFGTVFATVPEFTEIFGAAHEEDPGGERVRRWWFFETPRGRVSVREVWHNPENNLSLCAIDWRATLWAAKFFRVCGIKAKGVDNGWRIGWRHEHQQVIGTAQPSLLGDKVYFGIAVSKQRAEYLIRCLERPLCSHCGREEDECNAEPCAAAEHAHDAY